MFADALTVNPRYHPGRGQNQNGLFDPRNPGCAGGPRSITVLGQSKSPEQENPSTSKSSSTEQQPKEGKHLQGELQPKNISSKIDADTGLVRAAKEACKNTDVQKDINHLEEQLAKGNDNPGSGRKPICKGVIEHRGKNGGRLYVRESDGVIEILAKSGKKKSNQKFVINRLQEIYG